MEHEGSTKPAEVIDRLYQHRTRTVLDVRTHQRRQREIAVQWAIPSQGLTGDGVLLDVSVTGARLRIQELFIGNVGAVFTLESAATTVLPSRARVRWYRRLPGRPPVYVCGLFFEHGLISTAWREWLNEQTSSREPALSKD